MEENISLNDYAGGFLGGQHENALELLKAMQAGSITGRDTADQSLTYEPLKVESLETTLKVLEFRQKDIKLLNAMPKLTAYNTVEEFLQLSSYGNEGGGFYNEGELSDTEDSQYVRRSSLIKYLQITGQVTLQAQMVKSHIDAMRQETENKVMWITRAANSYMTKGNSGLVSQEWDGLFKQHASIGTGEGFLYESIEKYMTSNVVIDLRGASLKQENIEEGAVRIDANYGNVSHVFAPTVVLSTLSQDYFKDQRIMLNASSPGSYSGKIGTIAKSIDTTIGEVALMPDKFMANNKSRTTSSPATNAKAPAAPVSVSLTVTADTTSKLQTGETGTVYYAVAARNRFGESALTQIGSAAATLAVGSSVDLRFTAGVGANSASCFVIYRSVVTSASSIADVEMFPIFEVSAAELTAGYDGGAAGRVRDRHRFLPNTEKAFLTEMVDEVLSFKQLAPISKLDLAVISMSKQFITFMFATPQLYAPKKKVIFINCGKRLTA
jgi:hypothetical protein